MDSQENSFRFSKMIYSHSFLLCFLKEVETEGRLLTPFYEASITLIPNPGTQQQKGKLHANIPDEH